MPKHAPTTLVSYKTYVLKGSKNALPSNIISGWVCWQKRSETLQFSRCWYCLRLKDIPEANLKLNPNTKHQSVYIFKILLYYYTRFHKSLNWKSSPTTWYKLLPRGILKSQDILLLPQSSCIFIFSIWYPAKTFSSVISWFWQEKETQDFSFQTLAELIIKTQNLILRWRACLARGCFDV